MIFQRDSFAFFGWFFPFLHYDDVTMGGMTSQITSLAIVYSTVYSGADQRKHQSPATLAFVRGIPAQMASNAETASIWWRHHDCGQIIIFTCGLERYTHYQGLQYITTGCSSWWKSYLISDSKECTFSNHSLVVITHLPNNLFDFTNVAYPILLRNQINTNQDPIMASLR